jgi:hypothetical protein
MKNKSLFILIFFLILLATVLAVWKLFLTPKPTPLPTVPVFPTPTVSPLPTSFWGHGDPNIEREIYKKTQNDYPLLPYVPYQTTNWKIDYKAPLTLEIVLKKDTPEIRQEVLNWIQDKGVDPNTHKIDWVGAR